MDDKPHILIIDDDKVAAKSTAKGLAEFYNVDWADNGEAGIAKAIEQPPDFVLLDVDMPGMNGYEVCEQLRREPSTHTTPIVFLSARDKMQEKIRGYEAGGDDFIVKPSEPEELMAKLQVLTRFKSHTSDLSEKVHSATEVAMLALTGNSEMGLAMTFVEQSYLCNDFESLAAALLKVTDNLDLRCTLMLLPASGPQFYCAGNMVAPLEADLMQRMHDAGRFTDFGNRTVINYPAASLLIKNMPKDNPARYGRIKDLLPSILGAASARVKAIETELALKKQTRELNLGYQAVESTLRGMSDQLKREQMQVSGVIRGLLDDLEKALPTMGLEEDQEAFLVQRIDRAVEDSSAIVNDGTKIGDAFDTVLRMLEHINERQAQILDRLSGDKSPS